MTGEIGTGVRYDRRESDSFTSELLGYESFLKLGLSSWIWDPRMLSYRGWARVFWRDLNSIGPNEFSSVSQASPNTFGEQQTLDTDFDVRITLFQRRPYRFDLFATRNNRSINVAQLPPFETVYQTYGVETKITAGGFAINAVGQFLESEYQDFFITRHEEGWAASAIIAKRTDGQDFKTLYRYRDRRDLLDGFDYREHNITINEFITPSKTTRLSIQGGLRNWETSAGSSPSVVTNTYTLSPSFLWRPDEWSLYNANANFLYSEIVDSSRLSSGAFAASVFRQVKRGLWVRGGGGGAYSLFEPEGVGDDTRQTSGNAFAGVQYTRLVRYYRVTTDAEAAGSYIIISPGDDGPTQTYSSAISLLDPHLKEVIWFVEGRALYSLADTSGSFDQTTYQARAVVWNKKKQTINYRGEAGFLDTTQDFSTDTLHTQSVFGTGSLSYAMAPGHSLSGSYGYTYVIEPEPQNTHSAGLNYYGVLGIGLGARAGATYYAIEPFTDQSQSNLVALTELNYRIRRLSFLMQYYFYYRETGLDNQSNEHKVFFQVKRDFQGFYVRPTKKRPRRR